MKMTNRRTENDLTIKPKVQSERENKAMASCASESEMIEDLVM